MRKIGLVTVVTSLLLLLSYAQAEDHVRFTMDGEDVCVDYLQEELHFYITVESADTAVIAQGINGFVITATGSATYEFVEIRFGPQFEDIGYTVLRDVDGITPDTFVVGFFDIGGLPLLIEELYFTLVINTGPNFGDQICIDSSFVPPALDWIWYGPEVELLPGFVNQDGGNSPYCVNMIELPCASPYFTVVPPDTGLHWLQGCGNLSFGFQAHDPNVACCEFRVLEGPGSIDQTSCTTAVYICPPLTPGTYPVLVEAMSCCNYDYSQFDVVFHEEARPDGDCNCDGGVDIDDVVYLIAYIFSGGYEPHANPDCTGDVDIDDVVYLIAYIFSGGPAPCG